MSRTISDTKGGLLNYLSLFTSFGTLLCCALPSLLVLLGMGATVVTVLSAVPWLVTLSRHKGWVFLISGVLIGGNLLLAMRSQGRSCPADARDACNTARTVSRAVLWLSLATYCVGVFSAYLLGPLLMRFG